MNCIVYKDGYKYQLHADYWVQTPICPSYDIVTDYLVLKVNGGMLIRSGYAWDGPSGPAIDTKNFMRPSLVHDALYQLMRDGQLHKSFRNDADVLLRTMCIEDGMTKIRAWLVYHGVRFGGGPSANSRPADYLTAPKGCDNERR